jgi:hypothetical protein
MTHPDHELLSAFVDDDVDASARARINEHLAGCGECAATLRALRATVSDLASLRDPPVSELDSAAVRSAVRKARQRTLRTSRWALAASGAAAVVVAIVAFSLRGGPARSGSASSATSLGRSGISATALTVEGTDYDRTTASALLQGGGTAAEPKAAAGSALTEQGIQKGPSADEFAPAFALDSAASRQAQACDTQVRSSTRSPIALERSIYARFDGVRAFFFVYSTQNHRELWVLRERDCYTLYFAQTSA